jgi:hypothetical protein
VSAARVWSSRSASGPPRCVPGGAPVVSSRCSAATKARRLSVEPGVDRPRPRIPERRLADRDDLGQRHRQPRAEARQQAALLLDLSGRPVDLRQAHEQPVAEPVEDVVRPVRGHGRERQPGPVRELLPEQTPDEVQGRRDLVGVHHATA